MSVFVRQAISIGKLLLNVQNYRIVTQESQIGARNAIIAEQGKKLVVLAKDIATLGLSPFDLPMVIDAEDDDQNFIMMEGNRRLTAIQLMLSPELAKDTPIHAAFVRLNRQYSDAIPKVIDCVIAPSRKVALDWGNKKHASGLDGAGTEAWTSMAKARAEKDQGMSTPALDAVNFVLTNNRLNTAVRGVLEGSQFNITTLSRLVTTKELQQAIGIEIHNGRLCAKRQEEWTKNVLTDVISIIASSKKDGQKWTERSIDTAEKRKGFVESILTSHPSPKLAAKKWVISDSPKAAATIRKKAAPSARSTPSTEEQQNLIPKGFKLELPAGKINDVFVELKKLDVVAYRHAVSVLFRVFIEFTLDDFLKKRNIQLPTDKQGKAIDKLNVRLSLVIKNVKDTNLMTDKELKPIRVAQSDPNSPLAPDTLNSYVHSKLMNPDPLQLKLSWANFQLFVERLWSAR